MIKNIHDKLPLWRGFHAGILALLDALLSQNKAVILIESKVKS